MLDGELDVAQVAIVPLQRLCVVAELPVGARIQPLELGEGHGVADAGDDVLTLRVRQVVAIQSRAARGRVAGEGDATAGVGAEVAEHHALHGDRGSQVVGDVLTPSVETGAFGVPGPEHSHDRPLQLQGRGLWEVTAGLVADQPFVHAHQPGEVGGVEMEVVGGLAGLLHQGHGLVEQGRVDAHDRAAVHLDEPTVGVPGEALVA